MVATDTILALLADHLDAQALLDRTGEEAASTVRLPVGGGDDLVDGGAVLAAEQSEDLVLLGALVGGLFFAVLRLLAALPRTMRGAVVLVSFLAMMGSLSIGQSGTARLN